MNPAHARKYAFALLILGNGLLAAWQFRLDKSPGETVPANGGGVETKQPAMSKALAKERPAAIKPLMAVAMENAAAAEENQTPEMTAPAVDQPPVLDGADTEDTVNSENDSGPLSDLPELSPEFHRVLEPVAEAVEPEPVAASSSPPESVELEEPPQPADDEPPPAPRKHKIRDGDSLASLAQQYLGDSQRFWEIFRANQDVLTDPQLLTIGMELLIPGDEPAEAIPETKLAPVPMPEPSGE